MLPPFPTDDATLDLLDRAVRPGPEVDRSSLGDFMDLIRDLAGAAGTDPSDQYHTNDVIAALLDEVRRLRASGPPEPDAGGEPAGATVVVHDPPSLGYRIDRMFAYLSTDETGEGVIALPIGPGGSPMPLVGADADRMLSYRKAIGRFLRGRVVDDWAERHRVVRLVRFDARTDVEEFSV